MCRGLNVKNTYLEACGGGGNVVVGGTKIGFIDLRWSETKLREGVGGRNASKNAVARFDLPASLITSRGNHPHPTNLWLLLERSVGGVGDTFGHTKHTGRRG